MQTTEVKGEGKQHFFALFSLLARLELLSILRKLFFLSLDHLKRTRAMKFSTINHLQVSLLFTHWTTTTITRNKVAADVNNRQLSGSGSFSSSVVGGSSWLSFGVHLSGRCHLALVVVVVVVLDLTSTLAGPKSSSSSSNGKLFHHCLVMIAA